MVEIKVTIYKDARAYQSDAPKMAAAGWQMVDTASFQQRRSIGGLLFIPFAAFRPPKGQFTVSYQREEGTGTTPLTFKEKLEASTARMQAAKAKRVEATTGMSFWEKQQWMKDERKGLHNGAD